MKFTSRNNPGRPGGGDPDLPNAHWFIKELARYKTEFLTEIKINGHDELFIKWRCQLIYQGNGIHETSSTLGYDITEIETPPELNDLRNIVMTTRALFKNQMEEFKREFYMYPLAQELSEEEIEKYASELYSSLSKI